MISRISLSDFRNYGKLDLSLSGNKILFTGENGQGKTNLLEAVFFLGMLRSFRTPRIKELTRIGADGFSISCEINGSLRWTKKLEVDYCRKRKLRIDGTPVLKATEFIGQIRPVAFSPDDILLVTGPSSARRRFIDMFICPLDKEYLSALQNYNTAIKMRNAALKQADESGFAVAKSFEPILAESGSVLIGRRTEYIEKISNETEKQMRKIFPENTSFKLNYQPQPEMSDPESYMSRLGRERKRDLRKGFTTSGPHGDDFDFVRDGKSLRAFGSAGQCRLAALCLKLAKLELYEKTDPIRTDVVVLVDEVTGELDRRSRDAFFSLTSRASQVFFTFTEDKEDAYFKDAERFSVTDASLKHMYVNP